MASLQQQQMMLSMNHYQAQLSQQQQLAERLARLERAMTDSCYGSSERLDTQRLRAGAAGVAAGALPGEAGEPVYLDNYSSLSGRNQQQQQQEAPLFDFRPNFPLFADRSDGSPYSPPGGAAARSTRNNLNNNQSSLSAMVRREAQEQQQQQRRLDAILNADTNTDDDVMTNENPYRVAAEYRLPPDDASVMYRRMPWSEPVAIETIQARDLNDESSTGNMRHQRTSTARSAANR